MFWISYWSLSPQVDALLRSSVHSTKLPAISAIVVLNDSVLWNGNFGKKNISDPSSPAPNEYTVYRWDLQSVWRTGVEEFNMKYDSDMTKGKWWFVINIISQPAHNSSSIWTIVLSTYDVTCCLILLLDVACDLRLTVRIRGRGFWIRPSLY